ncbi:hypothetical protein HG530_007626 [Fusarium avenaceum]|nr:hypothetical protein HG530_007626 [Fusarium avenaceum]
MPSVAISAASSSQRLSTERSQGSSSDNFSSTVLGQLAVVIAATIEESSNTGTSESALCQVALVVGTFATLTATNDFATDIVVIVITIVAIIATSAIKPLNGIFAFSTGVSVFVAIVVFLLCRAMSMFMSVFMSMLSSDHLLSLRFLFTNDNHAGLLLYARRNHNGRRGGSFLDNDFLRFGSTLSNNNRSWRRRRVVRGVVFRFLAISLNIASMSVVDVFFHTLLDTKLPIISTFSPHHLVLDLDIIVE